MLTGIAGRSSGSMRPRAQILETHQHTLFRQLRNASFSRNFGQNMPKKMHFFEKAVNSPQCRGLRSRIWLTSGGWGILPQTPTLLFQLIDIDLSKCVSSVKHILLFQKINKSNKQKMLCFCVVCTFAHIFHFKICSFCWVGRKNRIVRLLRH